MSNPSETVSPSSDNPFYPDRWTGWALLVCFLVTVFRLAYLAWLCPYNLAQDEAHYWDWSRHLDWSYYSKGPLVAWLIALSNAMVGPIAPFLECDPALRVRLLAPFFGGGFLLGLFFFTRQTIGSGKLAFGAMLTALTLPPVAVAGLLMTIDAPYTCCWVWALVFAHQALLEGRSSSWILLGVAVGIGILAKYTMVLFIPSLFLAMIVDPLWRRKLLSPAPWVGILMVGICCAPILIWNIKNDFVTLRHVGNLAGVDRASSGVRWMGPLAFLGGQMALLLGFWFVAWCVAMVRINPWRETDPGKRLAWWLSAPTFVVFGMFSLKTGGGEVNWPVTAYLAGVPLVLSWVVGDLKAQRASYAPWVPLALGGGALIVVLLHASPVVQPLLAGIMPVPNDGNPTPIRRIDPTCRLLGWRELTKVIDEIREKNPGIVLAAHRWSSVGLIGFYCSGQPQVECLGAALGDRHSQYDLWPNPVKSPGTFLGKDFVIVDALPDSLKNAFTTVELPTQITGHGPTGVPVARWSVVVARGFKGFDNSKLPNRGW